MPASFTTTAYFFTSCRMNSPKASLLPPIGMTPRAFMVSRNSALCRRSLTSRLSLAMTEATIQLNLQGEPYQRYAIDVSEDLITWNQIAIVQASAAGAASFAVSSGPGPHRFYRARAIP